MTAQVTWEDAEDPENPKNWTYKKKWAATLIVSSFTFISPVSSSMVAPALNKIGLDLGVNSEIEKSLMLSIFVLAYAIGPLFLGPLSEIYGRVIVLQLSNLFFLAFNIGCGFAQTKGQLIAFRFMSGLGGSAPLALGGGVLSDCWRAEERGKSISIYSLAPLLGPAVGPIAGGFIAMKVFSSRQISPTLLVDMTRTDLFPLLFFRRQLGDGVFGRLRSSTPASRCWVSFTFEKPTPPSYSPSRPRDSDNRPGIPSCTPNGNTPTGHWARSSGRV